MNRDWYIVLQDGNDPFIAYPIENMDGKLKVWMDNHDEAHPVYENDLVQQVDVSDFQQVEI